MLLLVALLAALRQAPSPDPPPRVRPPRIEAEVVVDGRLDEPAWAQAARLDGFRQYQPVDGRPAEQRTEVLVWYSPTAIHFGIVAHDAQPGGVLATVADRDKIGNDDKVVFYLDTFNDRRRAFVFGVNPLGIQEDGIRSEGSGGAAGNLNGGNLDRSPDFIFQSKGRLVEDGYVVEVRIPFKSLRYQGSGTQDWGLNVERTVKRTGYVDTWTDVRRANASFLAQSGTLEGLHDLRSGLVTEVQPFVTATATGLRAEDGTFGRDRVHPDAGLNLRLSRTSLALDATVNPDFSQVESDVGLVTVNERFALFFPERRPFFLEGIDLFATPNQLIYTRQVADPAGGAKLTGKFGRWGVAWIGAVDHVADAPDALVNLARVRRDLGANSLAGLTLTDRSAGGAWNRVAAADARLVFGKLYYWQGQMGYAWTRDAQGDRRGALWQLETDRTGRQWGFNVALVGVADGFATRSGFVNRTGIITGRAFNRVTWYGARGAAIEQFQVFLNPQRIWRYTDPIGSRPIEGGESADFQFRFRGGWTATASARRNFYTFDPAAFAGITVGDPAGPAFDVPGRLDGLVGVSARAATPTWRGFDANLRWDYGRVAIFPEASAGRELRLSGGVGLRPTPSIRVTGTLTYQRLTRARTGAEFGRTILPRLQAEYQPRRQLFFRFIGEYRSQRQAALEDPRSGAPFFRDGAPIGATTFDGLRMDWLVSFVPSPGTVGYLGYGASLTTDEPFDLGRLARTSDGFFLKLSYLFRR